MIGNIKAVKVPPEGYSVARAHGSPARAVFNRIARDGFVYSGGFYWFQYGIGCFKVTMVDYLILPDGRRVEVL